MPRSWSNWLKWHLRFRPWRQGRRRRNKAEPAEQLQYFKQSEPLEALNLHQQFLQDWPQKVPRILGAVAKALELAGPPPRTRQSKAVPGAPEPAEEEVADPFRQPAIIAPNTGIEAALAQQSTAITTLVAHLANQADPLGELSSTATSSSSTKGVQRRERLQNDLASRNSAYYLQVMQQVHRRLHPGRPAPKTESDLAGLSFLSYLEKNGGFRHHRDSGLLMWLMGHIMEAAATDDTWLMKERLALAIVALDQSVADQGDWTLGYLLSLAEDPPIALFQEKTSVTSPFGSHFRL